MSLSPLDGQPAHLRLVLEEAQTIVVNALGRSPDAGQP